MSSNSEIDEKNKNLLLQKGETILDKNLVSWTVDSNIGQGAFGQIFTGWQIYCELNTFFGIFNSVYLSLKSITPSLAIAWSK